MSDLFQIQSWSIVAFASFLLYAIFSHWEPQKPLTLALLLLFPPLLMTQVVHPHFTSTSLARISTWLISLALVMLYTAIYRLGYSHPLARMPGPVLNKLSKLRMVWVASTGKQHRYYRELHSIYGDVVRTGPNEVSIIEVDAIQDVLGGLPKGPAWDNRQPPGQVLPVIEQRDPVEHQRRRKPWNRAFSTSSLKTYEPIIADKARELVDQLTLASKETDEMDLGIWMRAFAFDAMGNLAFDTDFEFTKRGGDTESIWPMFELGIKACAVVSHISWLLPTVHALLPRDLMIHRMVQLAKKWVGERVERGSRFKDFFYHLMDEDAAQSERPSLKVVASDGVFAVIAGADTVSAALGVLFYFLLSNHEKLRLLRAEIDMHFKRNEEPVDFATLAGMEYLNGCINEALRIYPPAMSGSQRHVPKGSGGKMVGSHFIAEGNNVIVHTFSIHHDPRNFSDPDSFLPERWLSQDPNRPSDFIHKPNAFIPFSVGPQNCAGKGLAILELRAVVSFLVQRFDITAKGGPEWEQWEDGIEDWFATMLPPLPVHLKMRH